jgi:hypothetical protein
MNANAIPATRFLLGRIVATSNALSRIAQEDILFGIQRHQVGDWGELRNEDIEENEGSLHDGGRLLSVFYSVTGVKFYIITEADRSVTTVLLPEDY